MKKITVIACKKCPYFQEMRVGGICNNVRNYGTRISLTPIIDPSCPLPDDTTPEVIAANAVSAYFDSLPAEIQERIQQTGL